MENERHLPLDETLPATSPEAYVEALVRRAGTSFFWGMRRLEAERRDAVYAVYALCREVDDIADGDGSIEEKKQGLSAWRSEISALYADGNGTHPIGIALKKAIRAYGLQSSDIYAVIDGMEMDAFPRVRIRDDAELDLYCDRVACAVGRLCVRIFGMEEKAGIELADNLGMALQLTNILRDIAEDAARDRVYLPSERLAAAGAEGEEVQDFLTAPGLEQVCETIANRAEGYFAEAKRIAAGSDHGAARPAIMMMHVYWRILRKLQQRGWQKLVPTLKLSKLEKTLIAIRYGLFT